MTGTLPSSHAHARSTRPAQRRSAAASTAATETASAATTFAGLGVPQVLVTHLDSAGITSPFPIQSATLPDTLAGRDVLGRGRTGSGKTLAFALPMVVRLAASGSRRQARRPRALVLAPTRELATQIAATVSPLATAMGLSTTTVFGGVPQGRQVTALAAGVDILIACPGRLEDLLQQRVLSLDAVEVTVLDEADHMADLGFLPGVKRLLDATPSGGQRMLFSATLDNGVDVLVRRYLSNPLTHSVDSAASPVAAMTHHLLSVSDAGAKTAVVRELASGTGRRLLFTRTKHSAKKLAKQLTAAGIPAVDLHGNLSQNARERNLSAFADGSVRVLVATDIAARGIHVDDIELVVHVDPPTEHKAYLHRSGRTARAGAGGDVVTVVLPEQRREVSTMTRQAGISATQTPATAGSDSLMRLVGDVAPHVQPAPPVAETSASRPTARSGGGRSSGVGRSTARGGAGSGRAGSGRTGSGRAGSGRVASGRPAGRSGGRSGAPAVAYSSTSGDAAGTGVAAGRTGGQGTASRQDGTRGSRGGAVAMSMGGGRGRR